MRVLFLCHRLPFPPKRGGKIRPFNIIRHLSESGHEVSVGSIARSREEESEGRPLANHCSRVMIGRIGPIAAGAKMLLRLPTAIPSSMGYFHSWSLHRQVAASVRENRFDLVFVHCSSAAQYAVHAAGIPSILDFGDMDSQKWLDYSRFRRFPMSMGFRIEGSKLERAEKRLAASFDLSTCTTQAELETLNGFSVAKRTGWFPNGVDSDFFSPSRQKYDTTQICFIGRMDYYPNQQAMIYFCKEVLPSLRKRVPGVSLKIVGAEPSAEIRNLANLENVEVTGTVDDVRPHVQSAALTVAPLFIARGTQNKILEAMAMGVPVVCSSKAAGGVNAQHGEHLMVANTRDEYIDAISLILENPSERRRLSEASRARVLSHHSWPASMKMFDELIGNLC